MKKFLFFFSVGILFLSGCGNQTSNSSSTDNFYSTESKNTKVTIPTEQKSFPSATTTSKVPSSTLNTSMNNETDKNKSYSAILHTTEGDIEITLNEKETPKTVENFVSLSKKNFYDNTIFHRVIKGFMIQGGDPEGNGTGGPGYTFDDEPFTGEYTRGTVAMANRGPDTNGSQFFIMHENYPLQKNYVIFGHVSKGMEVVDKIANAEVLPDRRESSKPLNPVIVKDVEIQEK